MRSPRELARSALARRGYVRAEIAGAPDVEAEFRDAFDRCLPYTMAGMDRGYALYKAVQYVAERRVPGAVVECGVWRGGSSMIAAHALMSRGDTSRDIYLFDTFEGMTAPTDRDVSTFGEEADATWVATQRDGHNEWCYADQEDVRRNMDSTGYPPTRIHLVPGPVEETIPGSAPDEISVLRLDTDWYESTAHELRHLYPRLARGGVLIVDDYGHWHGARQAIDEYFGADEPAILLNRIDYTGRIGVRID